MNDHDTRNYLENVKDPEVFMKTLRRVLNSSPVIKIVCPGLAQEFLELLSEKNRLKILLGAFDNNVKNLTTMSSEQQRELSVIWSDIKSRHDSLKMSLKKILSDILD